MKKGSTFFLRFVVIILGLIIFGIAFIGFPWVIKDISEFYPKIVLYPIITGIYLTALPFYYALFKVWALLGLIDSNNAFSMDSVSALRSIKVSAYIIAGIYTLLIPVLYIIAEVDDAPGVLAIPLIATFAAMVIAVFASVLERLLREAVNIKSDNDLTI